MSRKSREKRKRRKYVEYLIAKRAARRLLGVKLTPSEVVWEMYNTGHGNIIIEDEWAKEYEKA